MLCLTSDETASQRYRDRDSHPLAPVGCGYHDSRAPPPTDASALQTTAPRLSVFTNAWALDSCFSI